MRKSLQNRVAICSLFSKNICDLVSFSQDMNFLKAVLPLLFFFSFTNKKNVLWKFPTLVHISTSLESLVLVILKNTICTHPFLITLTPPVLNGSSFPLSTLSTLILRAPAGGDPPNYLLFLVYAALEMPPSLSKITDFTIWTFI